MGLSAGDRNLIRLELRACLLKKYNPYEFPPPGQHVCGLPVTTFEALMTNLEWKIQIYDHIDGYNPRILSTLDCEIFFSILGEFTSGGKSLSIRPKEIPRRMHIATALAKLYLADNP